MVTEYRIHTRYIYVAKQHFNATVLVPDAILWQLHLHFPCHLRRGGVFSVSHSRPNIYVLLYYSSFVLEWRQFTFIRWDFYFMTVMTEHVVKRPHFHHLCRYDLEFDVTLPSIAILIDIIDKPVGTITDFI
jgi:hypothetical protein